MYWVATPRRDSAVRGKLLLGLKKKDMAKLHNWEETKEEVWVKRAVVVMAGKKRIKTIAYLGNKKHK